MLCINDCGTAIKHVPLICNTVSFFKLVHCLLPISSVMPIGKRINSTVKKIICTVYIYIENESKKCKGSVMKLEKMAEATGYCKQTVEGVITEKEIRWSRIYSTSKVI